jgi:hypothetical protein
MRYISFAWTTAAVQAQCKDVTRREWDDDYAARFQKGEVVGALDKLFRAGGKQFGTIRLLEKPYKESESNYRDSSQRCGKTPFCDSSLRTTAITATCFGSCALKFSTSHVR